MPKQPAFHAAVPVYSRMRVTGPSGSVSFHQVLQEPTSRTPFYVIRDEETGEILVIPGDQLAITPA